MVAAFGCHRLTGGSRWFGHDSCQLEHWASSFREKTMTHTTVDLWFINWFKFLKVTILDYPWLLLVMWQLLLVISCYIFIIDGLHSRLLVLHGFAPFVIWLALASPLKGTGCWSDTGLSMKYGPPYMDAPYVSFDCSVFLPCWVTYCTCIIPHPHTLVRRVYAYLKFCPYITLSKLL